MKLKLSEILQLEKELNGFEVEGKVYFEGFFNQKLPIVFKYKITNFRNFILEEKKKVEEIRNELIVKYGETNEKGEIFINTTTGEDGDISPNENYIKFINEYNELLESEVEIKDIPPITIEDLEKCGETNDDYQILFKLI
jgi:hypothetical protein